MRNAVFGVQVEGLRRLPVAGGEIDPSAVKGVRQAIAEGRGGEALLEQRAARLQAEDVDAAALAHADQVGASQRERGHQRA